MHNLIICLGRYCGCLSLAMVEEVLILLMLPRHMLERRQCIHMSPWKFLLRCCLVCVNLPEGCSPRAQLVPFLPSIEMNQRGRYHCTAAGLAASMCSACLAQRRHAKTDNSRICLMTNVEVFGQAQMSLNKLSRTLLPSGPGHCKTHTWLLVMGMCACGLGLEGVWGKAALAAAAAFS